MRDKDIQILWISGKSYKVDDEVKNHKHQFFQLQFFLSGSEQLIMDQDNLTLKANHLIIIPPNTMHHYKFLQNSTVLDIKFNIESAFYKIIQPVLNQKEFYLNTPALLMIIQQLQISATTPTQKRSETFPITLDTLLKLFLLEIYQEKVKHESLPFAKNALIEVPGHSKVQVMIEYLNNHYAEDITLETLSIRYHYSESYITRIFRNAIKMTPNQLLQKIRLEKGIQLLDSSNYPIEYIANSVGFSLNYFSKFFKTQKGMTPTDYRHNRQEKIIELILSEDFDLSMEPKYFTK